MEDKLNRIIKDLAGKIAQAEIEKSLLNIELEDSRQEEISVKTKKKGGTK